MEPAAKNKSSLMKRLHQITRLLHNELRLVWGIFYYRPDLVLLDSYKEYLSPLWIWPHIILAWLAGVRYAANLHDPVRRYQVGPKWWHSLSVKLAYFPLETVFVHDDLPQPSPVPTGIRVIKVPVGVYELHISNVHREETRRNWGVKPGQQIFLAFGYIRSEKNLDLVLRAAVSVPNAFIVIAGAVPADRDRPFEYYIQLAADLGLSDRCFFHKGFIPDDTLSTFFQASDFILLTYSKSFHSQSGVLNIAAAAGKAVLVSAGESPLVNVVQRFRLGITVLPDDVAAIQQGMNRLLNEAITPNWDEYKKFASWDVNALGILGAIDFWPQKQVIDGTLPKKLPRRF